MNWTLVVVIGILIVFSLIGLKEGIIKMALSCAFMVASIVITVFLSSPVKNYIRENTDWYDKIYSVTQEYFEQEGLLLEGDTDEITGVLPEVFQEEINEVAYEYLVQGYETYNRYIVDKVSSLIFSVAVMVGIFLCLLVIYLIVRIIITLADKLPVIKEANRFAGFLAGLGGGLIAVSFGFLIITMFSNTEFATKVYSDIATNEFLAFLYNKNILLIIIAKIF